MLYTCLSGGEEVGLSGLRVMCRDRWAGLRIATGCDGRRLWRGQTQPVPEQAGDCSVSARVLKGDSRAHRILCMGGVS